MSAEQPKEKRSEVTESHGDPNRNGEKSAPPDHPDAKLKTVQSWLGFWKFVLGTVVLGAFSTYLAHRIQQQEIDIKAQKQEHELRSAEQQYLERIADRVQGGGTPNRRVLAQMMSHVSQTQAARDRWLAYLRVIESDLEAEKAAAKEKETLAVQVSDQQKALLELNAKLEETRKQITDEAKAATEVLRQQIVESRAKLKEKELELAEAAIELERRRKEFVAVAPPAESTDLVTIEELAKDADLTGRRVTDIYRGSLDLRGIILTGADVNDVGLGSANLVNAIFDGARLDNVHLARAKLFGASFRQTLLSRTDFSSADLREADFTEARINDADASNTNGKISWTMTFKGADLRGVKGLTCDMLRKTNDWELAKRDAQLNCGRDTPAESQ